MGNSVASAHKVCQRQFSFQPAKLIVASASNEKTRFCLLLSEIAGRFVLKNFSEFGVGLISHEIIWV